MKKINAKKIVGTAVVALGVLFLLGWITCIILEKAMPGTSFSLWIKTNIYDVDATLEKLKNQSMVIVNSIIYIILVFAVCKVLRAILQFQMQKKNRTKTVITLIDGFIKYGGAIAIIILILRACGVDTTALFASVGVLTLVIGLGAQSLIADIIAGMFIIFENEYNVGEIVSIDDFRGTVTDIGIRSTKLTDMAGNIKIVNNSKISTIVNLSRETSLAVVDLDFPYSVPTEKVEKLLKENFESFKSKIPAIVDGPFYKGICAYGASNVTLKIVAKCKEEDRYQVERDLMREYRRVLNENGIDLSYTQIVINQAEKTNSEELTKTDKKQVEKFVKQQKENSKDLEDQPNN